MTAGRLIAALAALILALGWLPAAAQQVPPTAAVTAAGQPEIDYSDWELVARRAEQAVEGGRVSNAALETLRAELVRWRADFQQAQQAGEPRISALNGQIAALGPVPEEGTTEPEEVANRRAELNRELQRLQAPRRQADEAYSRADNLIREIDGIIRDRQASELLKLGPSPLVPANWKAAWGAVGGFVAEIGAETAAAWRSPVQRTEMRENLPVVLVLLLLAIVCLARGKRWTDRLSQKVTSRLSAAAGDAAAFVLSLGHVLFPLVGLGALYLALDYSNLLGLRGGRAAELLPALALTFHLSLWLGQQIFPRSERGNEVLGLPPERRAEGRLFAGFLGLVLFAIVVVVQLSRSEGWSDEAVAVLQFPVLVLAGVSLWRLGQLIGRRPPDAEAEGAEFAFRRRLARVVGRAVMVLGVLGPVLAAIGYQSAATFLTLPATMSLGLIAVLLLVQTFATRAYAFLTRRDDSEVEQALMPVLFGLFLSVASIPFFALIWGARTADLSEIWTRVLDGFTINNTRISPGMFLTFLVVFGVGYAATRLLQGTLRSAVLPKTKIDIGGQNAIVSGLGYVGIILAALAAIMATGIDLSALAIVFGALSVGIGFGLQNIVQNFISGIIMLVERPVAEGDWIEVGGKMGIVKNISVRSTRIETFDKTDVIVPNGEFISGVVTNWTRYNLTGRIIVQVGVAYGTDTRKVEAILREIAEAHPLVTLNPPPGIIFAGFGADSLNFEIRAILRDVNFGLATKSDMHHEIAKRFKEERIEIPFGQRDIWLRNPEALRGAPPVAPSAGTAPGSPAPRQENEPEQHDPSADDAGGDGETR